MRSAVIRLRRRRPLDGVETMKIKVQQIQGYTQKERVRFLRRFARELQVPDLDQAVIVLMRRGGAICIQVLNERRTTHELIGMLERAKLEAFEDLMQSRCERHG